MPGSGSQCTMPLLLHKYIGKDIGKELKVSELKNYTLSECLGKGGFGEVYLIKDKKETKYALKVIDLQQIDAGQKFEKEQKNYDLFMKNKDTCAKEFLNCYLGIYKTDKYGLILMNFFNQTLQGIMSGVPFFNQVLANKSILSKYIRWVKEIVESISYMHKNNIAHGDIKPDNILVNTETNTIAVTDFDTICANISCPIPSSVTNYYASPDLDETTTAKYKKSGHPVPIEIMKHSDWWATCMLILVMWFGSAQTIQKFPAMISDFINEVTKENSTVYNQISSLIFTNSAQLRTLLLPEENKAIMDILLFSYNLLKFIGLQDPNVNDHIASYIKTIHNTPDFNNLKVVSQKGGSCDDYYKQKYFKYKAKYIAIK